MSIQGLLLKFKGYINNPEIIIATLIVFVSVSSFFLGRLSMSEKTLKTQDIAQISTVTEALPANEVRLEEQKPKETTATHLKTTGAYVASKSGTKYHLPWCGSAKQIKEENKVWFDTKEEAERAGYTPASNCKGI